jgi:hypothetical protein
MGQLCVNHLPFQVISFFNLFFGIVPGSSGIFDGIEFHLEKYLPEQDEIIKLKPHNGIV